MIKGILLDIDDTIYKYNISNDKAKSAVFKRISDDFHFGISKIEEAYLSARNRLHSILLGTAASHSRLLYIQKTLEELNVFSSSYTLKLEKYFWEVYLNSMIKYDGFDSFIQRSLDKKIVIVTDLTAQIQHQKIEKLGLNQHIFAVVTSEEAGVEKPHPYIFKMALEKLDMSPAEVVMIGDNYKKDILGASELGIQSLWFNPNHVKKDISRTSISSFDHFDKLII